MKNEYDVITIGSGPSGLICAITAVMGIPIQQTPLFTGLILEKNEVGSFVRFGRLRITPKWHLMGNDVLNYLMKDVHDAGIVVKTKEEVIQTDLKQAVKMVKTDKNTYYCKKLAVCTGFFPYGHLAGNWKHIRVMFSPIETEVYYIPEETGYSVAVMGGKHGTVDTAVKLKALRPDLDISVIITDPGKEVLPIKEHGFLKGKLFRGTVKVKKEKNNTIMLDIFKQDKKGKERKCGEWAGRYILVNYDSYIHHTQTTSFLNDPGITLHNGYIKVDIQGNTGVPGVVAAGNIATPVSGVVTALSTGFTAGLNLNQQLHQELHNKKPLHFPWLSMDDPDDHPLFS
ncbi:MAG: NAD(P)/FAD-dependent oxidoreductase [Spirochaetales bacterium]|nr:NAD(P)/FAD-dependent oxidoreductase [Spirochaetales bacterium]